MPELKTPESVTIFSNSLSPAITATRFVGTSRAFLHLLPNLFCGGWMILMASATAIAHDTWVETNTSLVRSGDAVFVDLKLGNHGNDHRDFKLASKIAREGCTLELHLPNGGTFDLADQLVDVGYAPNEGYWSTRTVTVAPGLYTVSHTLDKVVSHGRPVRSIRSGKTHFLVSDSLDRIGDNSTRHSEPLGHPLELVLQTHPVVRCGPGQPVRVLLLLRGKPLADARVSFIPQGTTLREGFDETYERRTGDDGLAEFKPPSGQRYLIVAHHKAVDETSPEYDYTSYSATLTLLVPETCPCCTE